MRAKNSTAKQERNALKSYGVYRPCEKRTARRNAKAYARQMSRDAAQNLIKGE